MGVLVQFLCGYLTLPLYALVTQMGSGMRRAVFTENVVRGLKVWLKNARRNLTKNNSNISTHRPSVSWHSDMTTEHSYSDKQNKNIPEQQHLPALTLVITTAITNTATASSSSEITEEEVPCEQYHSGKPDITCMSWSKPKTVASRGIYDGEISFGSSWKGQEFSREMDSGEITSIAEEDTSAINQDVNVL